MPRPTPPRGLTAFLLFVIAFAVYALPGRNGGSADTFPAQLLPLSILGEGDLDFNEFTCPSDPVTGEAGAYDAARCQSPLPYYLVERGGRVVSAYPIIPGLLNVPAHAVARAFGVDIVANRSGIALVTAALVTAGAVALCFLLLAELGFAARSATMISFVFAFGTLAWSSAGTGLWQHGPSLLFLFGALYAMTRGGTRGLVWAGALLGVAVFTRPTNALIALPLAVHLWRTRRDGFRAFAIAAAFPLLLLAAYSQVMLGSVTALGQGQHMRFGSNPLEGIVGVLVSPARGLFVFSPVLLMGLLALPAVFARRAVDQEAEAASAPGPDARSRALLRPLLVGTALVILVHGVWHVWWGGHSFGYRLLTETLPGMVLLLAFAWETRIRASQPLVVLTAGLFVLSLWANAMGALVAPCGQDTHPDMLDQHPRRVWELKNTELIRCTQRVLNGGAPG